MVSRHNTWLIREMLVGNRKGIVLSGGYELAKRLRHGTILVNLDRRGMSLGIGLRLTRRKLYRLAGNHPVIPVAFLSLYMPRIAVDSITLVEHRGRECVFQAKGYDGEPHYYLSGFDRNEWPRPLYFLAELPREVASIKEAREALKPPSVLQAEKMGRRVYRQGDMFAIPTKITTEEILKQGGTIEDREVHGLWSSRRVRARQLYGTAHTATRVASMPDGTQLAWGYLYHEPRLVERTVRDHRPCPLHPRRWHLVARNTVPIAKPERRRTSSINERIWMTGSSIDEQIRMIILGRR